MKLILSLILTLACSLSVFAAELPVSVRTTNGTSYFQTLNISTNVGATVNNQTNIGTVIAPTVNGSTAANGDITINGTTSATKTTSYVILQDTGGNVGIGTVVPLNAMHIVGAIRAQAIGDTESFGTIQADSNYVYIDSNGTAANSGGFIFRVNDVSVEAIRILANGNVGIGTTTPATMLSVLQTTTSGNVIVGTNLTVTNLTTSLQGFASFRDNKVAPVAITFPASDATWTNNLNCNIEVYINNIGVTGTSIKKNGGEILSGLISGYTMILQSGEYFSETYTIGTPTGKYSPF